MTIIKCGKDFIKNLSVSHFFKNMFKFGKTVKQVFNKSIGIKSGSKKFSLGDTQSLRVQTTKLKFKFRN